MARAWHSCQVQVAAGAVAVLGPVGGAMVKVVLWFATVALWQCVAVGLWGVAHAQLHQQAAHVHVM